VNEDPVAELFEATWPLNLRPDSAAKSIEVLPACPTHALRVRAQSRSSVPNVRERCCGICTESQTKAQNHQLTLLNFLITINKKKCIF
jgi:hypothetical protein